MGLLPARPNLVPPPLVTPLRCLLCATGLCVSLLLGLLVFVTFFDSIILFPHILIFEMPRKDFLRDLEQATAVDRFPCISSVRAGEYDGSISFKFIDTITATQIDLEAVVSGDRI